MGANDSGTSNLPSVISHQPFSFLVALSASARLGYTVEESKSTKSTKVLIGPPPAVPNFSAACFVALSASQFSHARGVSSFW